MNPRGPPGRALGDALFPPRAPARLIPPAEGYGPGMAADRDNTNGESDYGGDTPQEPGNPAAGGSGTERGVAEAEGSGAVREPAEGGRDQGDLPPGADVSSGARNS